MQYPLKVSFKIMSMAPTINVTDATGEMVCHVKQKLFKLKEAVTVFTDESKQSTLCQIKADRIIDWSAAYNFYDASEETFGSVRRKGMRSLWKAHYEICDEDGNHVSTISEENPMAKVADSLLGEIPILGILTGYMFHPKYLLQTVGGEPQMRVTKEPAFLEGKYRIDKLAELDEVDELRSLMAFLMMCLLERKRG